MIRRLATTDSLLISLSVAVIVLVLWPRGTARQQFQIVNHDGMAATYSLAINDPALIQLRQFDSSGNANRPAAQLALAQWNYELASFYQQQTGVGEQSDDAKSAIVPAAFDQAAFDETTPVPQKIAPREPIGRATALHWQAEQQKAKQTIAITEQQLAQSRAIAPRVAMGRVLEGQRSASVMLFAIVGGLLGGLLYRLWQSANPTVALEPGEAADSVQIRFQSGSQETEIVAIPADSIRCRQPTMVKLRYTGVACLVSFACLAAVADLIAIKF